MHDPLYAILRTICGALAILAAIALVYTIVTGRRWLRPVPDRADDPVGFRLGVAREVCFIVGATLAATLAPNGLVAPVLALSVFLPELVAALIGGRFQWEADDKRIATPATFWRWVAFYGLMCAGFTAILVAELARPTTS